MTGRERWRSWKRCETAMESDTDKILGPFMIGLRWCMVILGFTLAIACVIAKYVHALRQLDPRDIWRSYLVSGAIALAIFSAFMVLTWSMNSLNEILVWLVMYHIGIFCI